MLTDLADLMHIDEQVLVIDCDLDQIPDLDVRQCFIFADIHGNKPRLDLTDIGSCLIASYFFYCAQNDAVPGKKLGFCRFRFSSVGNGHRGDQQPHAQHREKTFNRACHGLAPLSFEHIEYVIWVTREGGHSIHCSWKSLC
jgi:hypothetical protein